MFVKSLTTGVGMALPVFNDEGDLPAGIHPATLQEVCSRFGTGTPEREQATANLRRIHEIATGTGKVLRFIIFGSYVTAKRSPNDVDVVLLMCDDFTVETVDVEKRGIFDHQAAPLQFGASIFWSRPSGIFGESIDDFLASWQVKRDKTHRGIVEVKP